MPKFKTWILLGSLAQAESGKALIEIVEEYYERHHALSKPVASEKDIDRIFELFSDDFVYIHEGYGGEYSRQRIYQGYVRNFQGGRYKDDLQKHKIAKYVVGLNMVALTRVDGKTTLYEFRDGKIKTIKEYW